MLTAHVGNWQVAMTALQKLSRTVYLVMRPEENDAVKDALNIDSEQGKVRIISSESFLGGVVEIMSVLDRGCLVSIMGDRSYGQNFTEAVLIGDRVKLPHGAFSIAAAAECPVVVLWSARLSAKKYIVDVSHIIGPVQGTKTEKRKRSGHVFRSLPVCSIIMRLSIRFSGLCLAIYGKEIVNSKIEISNVRGV